MWGSEDKSLYCRLGCSSRFTEGKMCTLGSACCVHTQHSRVNKRDKEKNSCMHGLARHFKSVSPFVKGVSSTMLLSHNFYSCSRSFMIRNKLQVC